MLKWLLVIALVWLVYNFYFKKKTVTQNNPQDLKENDMVECATCKVYVTIDEAILSDGKYYCSKECLRGAK